MFDFQQTAFEKLDEFKGKKINGVLISNIPSLLTEINAIQDILVADSELAARVLLDDIICSSLAPGSSERTECDLGEDFFTQGLNTGLPAPERIDFFKKAWLQGVKALDALGNRVVTARRATDI